MCVLGQPSVAWFFPSNLLFWFIFIGPMPFVQKLLSVEHPSDWALYWTFAISFRGILTQLVSPILGALSDRWGRKPLQIYAVATTMLYVLPLSVLTDASSLRINCCLVATVLAGLAGSPFAVPFAYSADLVPRSESHKLASQNARVLLSMNIGFITSPLACGALFRFYGDHQEHAWQALLALAVINLLYTSMLLPESLGNQGDDSASPNRRSAVAMRAMGQAEVPATRMNLNPFFYFRLFLPNGPAGSHAAGLLRQLCSIIFWLYLAKSSIIACVVLFAMNEMGWQPAQAGLLLSLWGCVQLLSMSALSLTGTFRIRCLHDERVVAWIGLSFGLVGMLIFFVAVQGWILIPGMAFSAVSMVTLTAVAGYAGRLVDRTMQGEVQGLLSSVLSATEVLGPPVFGFVLKWGEGKKDEAWWYPNLIFLVGAMSVLMAMVCTLGLPKAADAARQCAEARAVAQVTSCGSQLT